MHIYDREGNKINVTNLDEAISQAAAFKTWSHKDPEYKELDKNLKAHWKHIYNELIKLRDDAQGAEADNRKAL